MNSNRYITEIQVSEITSLALSTLRNQRFEGRGIPYCKIGKSVRYNKDDVIQYMEQRKITPVNANPAA
ncbi:helix-turn-helix transcriptional regulator [candidate division KSB1 bacterium]